MPAPFPRSALIQSDTSAVAREPRDAPEREPAPVSPEIDERRLYAAGLAHFLSGLLPAVGNPAQPDS